MAELKVRFTLISAAMIDGQRAPSRAVFVDRFGPPEVLVTREVGWPMPSAREVLIRTAAISVNFGDVQRRRGPYPGGKPPPFIPGIEAAGTIISVGSEVSKTRIGERVVAYASSGAYAELVLARTRFAFALPDSINEDVAAASLTAGVTAYELVHSVSRLRSGQSVLVLSAAGGVGLMLVQLARLAGASLIVGAVGSGKKAGAALKAGCDHVVDYVTSSLVGEVLKLTPGGVDIVFDSVGASIFADCIAVLAPFGKLVCFGQSSGSPGSIEASQLFAANRSALGYNGAQVRLLRPSRAVSAARKVIDLVSRHAVTPLIDSRYPLEDANQAHAALESRTVVGKVVLVP